MTPEIAIELKKRYWERKLRSNPQKWQTLYLPYGTRVLNLWKFGVLIYELLHGYSPWEEPEWDGRIGGLHKWTKNLQRSGRMSERKVRERRDRIINEELPIDENLSQDCVDVLRAMLTKNIEKRPTLRQLASFPWFQGHWVDRGPFSRPPRKEPSEDGEMDDWPSMYPETR
ncbi:hypothetical protein VTN00DRAFT_4114 [Thermoascus crustaceus]|uniref:uncharacterized protein n=1 Tax=Thermoascus crustaceus TaxID=5088 RepID=UPI003743D318